MTTVTPVTAITAVMQIAGTEVSTTPVMPVDRTDLAGCKYLIGALKSAELGIPISFLPAGQKGSNTSGWQDSCTTSAGEIVQRAGDAERLNYACVAKAVPGGNLFLDDDGGIRLEYEKIHGPMDPTRKAQSCNGSFHYYYKHSATSLAYQASIGKAYISEPVNDGKGELWSLRMNNSYVVGPGSVVPNADGLDSEYKIVWDVPIAEIPDKLLQFLIGRAETHKKETTRRDVDGPIISGSRNNTLTSKAGKLRNAGANREEIESVLLRLNSERCQPPLDESEVCTIAGSISSYPIGSDGGTVMVNGRVAGSSAPNAIQSETNYGSLLTDLSDKTQPSWIMQNVQKAHELSQKPLTWVIEEMILEHGLHLFSGKQGSMKTMLAMMLAKSTACGEPFMGRTNIGKPITVVYVDRENPEAEIRRRCFALGLLELENFRIWGDWQIENPPPLTFDDPRLIECARRDNVLFVFDSLSSYLNGADENDTDAMMQIMGQARLLARGCSGAVILHHQAKNGPPGGRGSTAISASTDMAFVVQKTGQTVKISEERFRACAGYSMQFDMDFGGITGIYKYKVVENGLGGRRAVLKPYTEPTGSGPDQNLADILTIRRATDEIEKAFAKGTSLNQGQLATLVGISSSKTKSRLLNGAPDKPWNCIPGGKSGAIMFVPKGITAPVRRPKLTDQPGFALERE